MIDRLLARFLRHKDIMRAGKLYLRRYYLTPRSWRWRLFLHRIYLPDPDPEQHDHPWPFWTVPLWGGYAQEQTVPCDCFGAEWLPHHARGTHHERDRVLWLSPRHRPATHRHRITFVLPNTWTLVLAGRAEREWGFWMRWPSVDSSVPDLWPEEKWVPWYQYLGVPNEPAEEDRIR